MLILIVPWKFDGVVEEFERVRETPIDIEVAPVNWGWLKISPANVKSNRPFDVIFGIGMVWVTQIQFLLRFGHQLGDIFPVKIFPIVSWSSNDVFFLDIWSGDVNGTTIVINGVHFTVLAANVFRRLLLLRLILLPLLVIIPVVAIVVIVSVVAVLVVVGDKDGNAIIID